MKIMLVGAGPAGLACALALQCRGVDHELHAIDAAGDWLQSWQQRFAAQDIPYLRSPAVHHPHPDAFALLRRARKDELVRSGKVHLPTTELFQRFTQELIAEHGLTDCVQQAHAERLEIDADGNVWVQTSDGVTHHPDRLILATNYRCPPVLAAIGDHSPAGRIALGDAADVRTVVPGERIVVVGGGISAAHLAIGAARRGAVVVLVSRRRLETRRFDTDPRWLGPVLMQEFRAERDPHARRQAIDRARGGGTMPSRLRRTLAELEADGRVRCRERHHVAHCETDDDRVTVWLSSPGQVVDDPIEADRMWLATGGLVDVAQDPLCRMLLDHRPVTVAGGLPTLEPDLRWPGTNVHLVGGAAGLVIGPAAGNLVGQRRGALRIAAGMTGLDPEQVDRTAAGSSACVARSGATSP